MVVLLSEENMEKVVRKVNDGEQGKRREKQK
jgi:hypothetical protein